jgi:hypothetical protein
MLTLFFALIRFPSFPTPAVIVASGLRVVGSRCKLLGLTTDD